MKFLENFRPSRTLSEGERALVTHCSMFGSDGYPVAKMSKHWHWVEAFGVKGPPVVYKTKRDAVAAFEVFLGILHGALGEEARYRHIAELLERGYTEEQVRQAIRVALEENEGRLCA